MRAEPSGVLVLGGATVGSLAMVGVKTVRDDVTDGLIHLSTGGHDVVGGGEGREGNAGGGRGAGKSEGEGRARGEGGGERRRKAR